MENFDFFNSFLFPYVNLAVFLVLAYFILRKPFVGAISAKREAFNELMKKASAAKLEAEKRNQELKTRLSQLDKEVDAIKKQFKEQAEQEAKAIVQNAEQLAEHLRKEAKRIADAEIAAAKAAIEQEILKQVHSLATKEIQKNLDQTKQTKVIQQGLGALDAVQVEGRQ